VIAKRRQDEILLLADTMISDPRTTSPDIRPGRLRMNDTIPGRLKLVTIGECVTVAYAGNADPAGPVIKKARCKLYRVGLESASEVLQLASQEYDLDFIVASHRPETSLVRIKNGAMLDIPDNEICALGDDELFKELIEKARISIDTESLEHSDLRAGFLSGLLRIRI
jgi:hypothetical protein